jgi:hypothetical protein
VNQRLLSSLFLCIAPVHTRACGNGDLSCGLLLPPSLRGKEARIQDIDTTDDGTTQGYTIARTPHHKYPGTRARPDRRDHSGWQRRGQRGFALPMNRILLGFSPFRLWNAIRGAPEIIFLWKFKRFSRARMDLFTFGRRISLPKQSVRQRSPGAKTFRSKGSTERQKRGGVGPDDGQDLHWW